MSKRSCRPTPPRDECGKIETLLPGGVYERAFEGLHGDKVTLPGVEVGGRMLFPMSDDRLLPPLIVGIYSVTGKLLDVQSMPDPRAQFCCEVRFRMGRSSTNLIALPLLAEETDTRYLLDVRNFKATA